MSRTMREESEGWTETVDRLAVGWEPPGETLRPRDRGDRTPHSLEPRDPEGTRARDSNVTLGEPNETKLPAPSLSSPSVPTSIANSMNRRKRQCAGTN